MSGFFQDFLSDAAKGFFGNEYLRDYTHASKTFRTNAYAMAPKYKFLFHVYFDINYDLLGSNYTFPGGTQNFFGLAVKTAQLPKYSFDLHDLNQYNRRRIVQTKIKYDPVNITFHDDNNNLIRKLWYNYYTYYYKDSIQRDPFEETKGGASASQGVPYDFNKRTLYDLDVTGQEDWGYVGEGAKGQPSQLASTIGSSKAPFFRSINIYGFNQHNFVMYKLMNPMIESFSHDTYDYSQANGIMEHQMTLRYETVKSYEGAMDGKDPGNFVKEFGNVANYDKTVSPIAKAGSNSSILGQGGLVDGVGGVMSDLESGNYLGALQKTVGLKNTFKNPATILQLAKSEVISTVTSQITGTPNRNNQFSFPIPSSMTVPNITNNVNQAIGNILKSPPKV